MDRHLLTISQWNHLLQQKGYSQALINPQQPTKAITVLLTQAHQIVKSQTQTGHPDNPTLRIAAKMGDSKDRFSLLLLFRYDAPSDKLKLIGIRARSEQAKYLYLIGKPESLPAPTELHENLLRTRNRQFLDALHAPSVQKKQYTPHL